MNKDISVIDLFAGPGGLGEGFSGYNETKKNHPFKLALSIEKDKFAHKTLELRAFFRQFSSGSVPREYYLYLAKPTEKAREKLFQKFPLQGNAAKDEAKKMTLGSKENNKIHDLIGAKISKKDNWVLIGGPPCQAYSLVGRSRMKNMPGKDFNKDERHFLYREYLKIISKFSPPVFIMENVKGILSTTVKGKRLFQKILSDLEHPQKLFPNSSKENCRYKIFSLVTEGLIPGYLTPSDYIIRSENYGVPQARHRVILLGIRSNIDISPVHLKSKNELIHLEDVISGLPKIRRRVSKGDDSDQDWINIIKSILRSSWISDPLIKNKLRKEIKKTIRTAKINFNHKSKYKPYKGKHRFLKSWLNDNSLITNCNHEPRGHISEDLQRYFYASCYATTFGKSPNLKEFPVELLPKHKNVKEALKKSLFNDRFRVQLKNKPATTITSHISKDGHYYIHPDSTQCRSLTVREAARLQTFPDNYLFEGPRTSQYQQVGNAVPPLLASQIAAIVYDVLKKMG